MKLTDFINTDRQKAEISQKVPSDAVKTASVNRQIRSLIPGQTIQGEVVSRNGSEVQIRLSGDMIMNARLEQNMNLDIGKIMSFEVRNNGKMLLLSPLFANTATDANVMKALDMASLPVNQTTVNMTKQLMDAGLPIDRTSLQQVFREVNAFSQAQVSDIIDLHRLELPVTQTNVEQMSSYKNLTYQLTTGMTQVVDELYNTMQNMVQNGNVEGAARIYQELLQMFGNVDLPENLSGKQIELQSMGANGQVDGNGQINVNGLTPHSVVITDIQQNPEGAVMDEGVIPGDSEQAALLKMLSTEGYMDKEMPDNRNLPMTVRESLLNELSELTGQALPQDLSEEQLLKLVGKLMHEGVAQKDPGGLSELIKSDSLQAVLKENLLKNFLLKPEDVADSAKVDDLYSRLDKQLKGLTRVLEQTSQQGTEAFKAVNSMTQNLDFLQQVNQMYTYVQLPLKFQESTAHGDLYVYTNKKSLAQKDGAISALLHLDMESLGPVDVYVSLQSQKVNTQFYVQDEEMLDFLNEHMDILTNRLKNRGYDCSYQMQVRGEDSATEDESNNGSGKGGIHNLLMKSGHMNLAQYAFDVRA